MGSLLEEIDLECSDGSRLAQITDEAIHAGASRRLDVDADDRRAGLEKGVDKCGTNTCLSGRGDAARPLTSRGASNDADPVFHLALACKHGELCSEALGEGMQKREEVNQKSSAWITMEWTLKVLWARQSKGGQYPHPA